jgi:hypothetical protein
MHGFNVVQAGEDAVATSFIAAERVRKNPAENRLLAPRENQGFSRSRDCAQKVVILTTAHFAP